MRCPDHNRALQADHRTGVQGCPFCGGQWMSGSELASLCDEAEAKLTLETRDDSGAFAKIRTCPECAKPMMPWRLGKMDAWLEKCACCERYWVEKQDLRSLGLLAQQKKMQAVYQSFTPEERKEMVSDLARETGGQSGPALSPVQFVLAYIGIPSVTSLATTKLTPSELAAGRFLKVPYATWALAVLLAGFFVAGLVSPLEFGPDALAFKAGAPIGWTLFTATLVHFGWFHLIGNVGFLLAFGDGVEQRISRWMLMVIFLLLSPLTLWVEALLTSQPGVLIGGASGGVSILVGACLVLQPGARVTFVFLRKLPITVPMIAFGVFEMLFQALGALIGFGGTTWWAQASGLAIGLGIGALVRWRERMSHS